MRLKPIYRLLRLAALAAGLLAAASGCVFEYGEAPAVSGDTYRMSVTVFANFAPGTRSTRAGHADDKQEDGTAAENFIDFTADDFRIALFDNSGKYLLNIGGTGKWNVFPYASDNAVYRMECEVVFPDNVTKEEIDQLKESGFQVMVLANWRNAGGSYDNLFMPGGNPQNLAAIWKDGSHYNFPYRPVSSGGVLRSWMPSTEEGAARQLIPMFGFAKASKFETRTSGGIFYSNAQINMQRAVAKIEVLDNLVNQPSLSVSDVKMSAYNTFGRFIPDVAANENWDKVGEQVDGSSLPANSGLVSDELTFVHDEAGKKWIAYVPEMALPEGSQDPGTGKWTFPENRPHLNVTIEADAALQDFYDGGTYTAHFAKYDANSEPTIPADGSWNHILRNHIYRFSVNKVGLDVRLHLHVVPWSPDDEEIWDFTDHVTVQERLEWVPETYAGENKENGEVILSLDKGTRLHGHFRISTPVNGRWYARLIPLEGAKTNAVTFVYVSAGTGPDGEDEVIVPDPSSGEPPACLEISGIINNINVPSVFYIMPTSFDNEQESRFRLEFYVENLGVWMKVPVTPADVTADYYTIVRPSNEIH